MKVEWREIDCNYYCAKPTRHFILTAREIADGHACTVHYRGSRIHLKYIKTLASAQQSAARALQRLVEDVRGIEQ